MKFFFRRPINIFLISILIAFIDQCSKYWAIVNSTSLSNKILFTKLLKFQLTRNSGAAFSIFEGNALILGIISLLVSITVVYLLFSLKEFTFWNSWAFIFFLGGTIGNCIDRFRLGYVIDFMQLIPINFPIFNFADLSINIGLIFFVYGSFSNNSKKSIM